MAVGEKRAQREPGVSSCKPCRSPDPSDPHSSGVHHGRPLLGPLCAPPRPSFPGLGADSGAENSADLSSGGSEAQLKCLLLSTLSSSLLPTLPLSQFTAPSVRTRTASVQRLKLGLYSLFTSLPTSSWA